MLGSRLTLEIFFFAKRTKCYFHQNEIHFLEYLVVSKSISIKVKKIENIKNLLKPNLVYDIQVFLSFTIYY